MSKLRDEDLTYLQQTLFKLYDKDNNGILSFDEAMHFWRALGANPTEAMVKKMFEKAKEEDNSEMTCDYFVSYMRDYGGIDQDQEQKELIEAFKVFDSDGSGFISKDELRCIMGERGDEPLSEDELNGLMSRIDTNNDNKINYQELIAYLFISDDGDDVEYDEEDGEFGEDLQTQEQEDGY